MFYDNNYQARENIEDNCKFFWNKDLPCWIKYENYALQQEKKRCVICSSSEHLIIKDNVYVHEKCLDKFLEKKQQSFKSCHVSPLLRVYASLIDFSLVFCLSLFIFVLGLFFVGNLDEIKVLYQSCVLLFFLTLFIYSIIANRFYGSFAMKLLGMKLVNSNNLKLTWKESLLRSIYACFSIITFPVSYFIAYFDVSKSCLHDKLVSSKVIYTWCSYV